MAINIFAGSRNSEIFTLAQKFSPEFARHSSKVTKERLDLGFEACKDLANDGYLMSEWFNVVMQMVLQKIDIARAKNPLEEYGVAEAYETPFGAITQRLAVHGIKPVSPSFRGLSDGDSVDMFKVRKPKLTERFFKQNFDFQSWVTLSDIQIKLILQSEYGMADVTGGIVAQLEESYKKQKYLNELEAINHGMNSTDFPLQESQKINLSSWGSGASGAVTDAELLEFIQSVKNLAYAIALSPSSTAYNAGKFDSVVDLDRFVLLVRPEILTMINTRLMVGAYNPDRLSLPFDIKPVLNFGGLIPYAESAFTNRLYPVYNSIGEQIGWNTSENQTTVTVQNGDEYYKDTNASVLGVLIQKGAIFSTMQNGIQQVASPYNARGAYQNIFYNVIGAGVHVDYYYDLIIVTKPIEPGITITNTVDTVKVGSTLQMTADVFPKGTSITWSSGTTANATINSSTGVVTPVKAGDTVISASATVGSDTVTDTMTIHVEAAS